MIHIIYGQPSVRRGLFCMIFGSDGILKMGGLSMI